MADAGPAGDVEMQETLKRPPSADAAEVIVQRSDKAGDSGVCGCARRHLRLWLGAAAFAALALVIGLAVGLTMGKCGRWCQPSTPRRAFSYKHFESCKHVQEAFKSEVRTEGPSTGALTGQKMRPVASLLYFPYQSDYCDYCNCSGNAEFDPVFIADDSAAVPEAMASTAQTSPKAMADSSGSAPPSAADFTGTNNQVEGIDEADVIKTDGTYLYIVPRSGDVLVVSQVFPSADARVLSRVNLTRFNLRGSDAVLDSRSNTLAVLGSSAITNAPADGDGIRLTMAAIHLFDVTNKSAPVLQHVYEIQGRSLTARLLDGFLYVVVSTWPAYHYSQASTSAKMASSASSSSAGTTHSLLALAPLARSLTPVQAEISRKIPVAVSAVCGCEEMSFVENLGRPSGWITVVSMDMSVESKGRVKTVTHAGRGESVMVSHKNLYVSATNWDYSMDDGTRPSDGQWTVVLHFGLGQLGTPSFVRLLTVPGTIINQFAMDEHQGHLRIATTFGRMWSDPPTSKSNVYVYSVSDGTRTGAVEGLAPGERIYSVRFVGAMGYLVTFRQVDPLFVLDLSDEANPLVKGQLKIPGFSEYLHPLSDSLLLGLGQETTTTVDERVIQLGVKLSLFDVAVPESPKELDVVVVGARGSFSVPLACLSAAIPPYHVCSQLSLPLPRAR